MSGGVYIYNGGLLKRRSALFFQTRSEFYRGQKMHLNFFKINFLAPTQKTRFGAPRNKSLCASFFLGKDAKKGTHINLFRGFFGVKTGVPNRTFSATKS